MQRRRCSGPPRRRAAPSLATSGNLEAPANDSNDRTEQITTHVAAAEEAPQCVPEAPKSSAVRLRLERSPNEVRGLNSGDTVHVNSEPAVVRVGPGPLCAILSRERAKLCYRWQPAVIECWATGDGRLPREEDAGEPFRMPGCPVCANQVVTPDGVPLTDAELARRKRTCDHCGTVTDYDSEPALARTKANVL